MLAGTTAAALGLLAFFAYGGGFPNTDASWTLVWGRELLHLETPAFDSGPTPHPLDNALGVLAAAAHPASETVLLVAGYLVVEAPRLIDRREQVVDRDTRRTAAHHALGSSLPCAPLVVPNDRLVPVAASWLDVPVGEVLDGRDGVPPGSYLWGTEAAMRNLLVIEGRPGDAAPAPEAPVVRRSGGWTLMASC